LDPIDIIKITTLDCQNTFVLCIVLNEACIYKAKACLDFIAQTRLCLC